VKPLVSVLGSTPSKAVRREAVASRRFGGAVRLAAFVCFVLGCSPNWRNLQIAPLQQVAMNPRPRVHVTATGWAVEFRAPLSEPYSTHNDPLLLTQLSTEVERALANSAAVEIVERSSDADLTVDVSVSVGVYRGAGSTVWQIFDGLLLLAPSILGAPIGWITYNTDATFIFRDRDGRSLGRHIAHDEQNHYIAIYYGFHNVNHPFEYDLAAVLDSLVEHLRTRRPWVTSGASVGGSPPPGNPSGARAAAGGTNAPAGDARSLFASGDLALGAGRHADALRDCGAAVRLLEQAPPEQLGRAQFCVARAARGLGLLATAMRAASLTIQNIGRSGATTRRYREDLRLARVMVQELSPRVPRVLVEVPAALLASTRVRVNDRELSAQELGTPLPFDPGVVTVEINVTGREPVRDERELRPGVTERFVVQ